MAGRVAPPGRCSTAMRMLAAGALLWLAAAGAHAIVLDDPDHFVVKHTWSAVDLDVPAPLGGLVFSADGGTLFIVGGADKPTSALYALPVTRDAGNQVTAFGGATLVFAGSGGLDAGLERGPAGTLFYSYFDTNELAERPAGAGVESTFDLTSRGVIAVISGLTFSPLRMDPLTNFGRLQVSTGFGNALHEVPLVPAGGGVFTPGDASIFAILPLASIAGLQYVPGGTLAGNLLYANFDEGQLRVLRIDAASGLPIDAQSGEPTLGTTSPAESIFASDFGVGPLGLEFDARTGDDLFVTTFGGSPSDSLIQIGGFAGTFATTTTSTTSSTTLTTEPPPTSTSATTASTATTSTSATSTVPSTAPPTSSTSVSTSTSSLPPSTLPPTTSTSSLLPSTLPPTSSSTTTSTATTSSATTLPVSTTSSSVPTTSTSSTAATSSSTSTSTSTATSSTSATSSSTTSSTTPDASSTTVTSTSSSSLPPATTTSTTSSTVTSLPPTTTSTERPIITPTTTVPSGCERAPTFPSVRCRLTILARRVDDSREVVGPLEGPLLRHVQRAGRRAGAGEERASAGQTRRARRLVRHVLVELGAFASALDSKRGRAVLENVRAELAELADQLRADVRALRAAL